MLRAISAFAKFFLFSVLKAKFHWFIFPATSTVENVVGEVRECLQRLATRQQVINVTSKLQGNWFSEFSSDTAILVSAVLCSRASGGRVGQHLRSWSARVRYHQTRARQQAEVLSRIPQGSILGPLLFIIFTAVMLI